MGIRSFEQYQPTIGQNVLIDETSLVIGQVELADDVSIWPMTVLRGDVDAIRIGARSNIQDGTICHVTHYSEEYSPKGLPLLVGEDVTIGHQAILHACTIGNRCLIGMGSSLLDESVIEDEVMIGANSLVPPGKVLKSGYLYVGSPVKQVRQLSEKEIRFLQYSAAHYVELKNRHLQASKVL
jgi:carbonic anhydrase/acetyltransferase-like protein (isoleucine patch superfamily)